MKKFIVLIALTSVVVFACRQSNTSTQVEQIQKFKVIKGINLSHWLSQVPEWMQRDTFITKWDIEKIAEYGFDHVRIPIDEENFWTEEGTQISENFNYLKQCLNWCDSAGLKAIVDLHILRAHHFNAGNSEGKITLWTDTIAQDNFIELWKDLSENLHSYSVGKVAYELMNEPVADNPDDWNNLIARAVKEIRKLEPMRTLVIGSNKWQTAGNFPVLKIPENDTNILLSVHTYEPLLITHYTANWINNYKDYSGPVHYPGVSIDETDLTKYSKNEPLMKFIKDSNREYNKEEIEKILMPAIHRAKELGLPLYCGEFGCLPSIPREMRLQYYKDLVQIFNENGIAYAAWDYKGDFGIQHYDREKSINLEADSDLIKILGGK